jgi:hypothetical protein
MKLGGFGPDSGTSMASPYIAGCAALFLQAKPDSEHSFVAFKTALQNAARPIVDSNPKQFKGPASVAQQGAGLVQMMDVLSSTISVSPSYVSLNDTVHHNGRQTFTITNHGNISVTYRVDLISAAGLTPFESNGTVAVPPKKGPAVATISSSTQTVRVAPGSSTKVDIDFKGPKIDPMLHVLYSGYVRFRPEKANKSTPLISVPFLGMKGDYKTVAVFDPSFGLRYYDRKSLLRRVVGGETLELNTTKVDNDDGDQDGGDGPLPKAILQFRLLTACRLLVLDLVSDQGGSDPTKVKSYGLLNKGVGRYLPRNDNQQGNQATLLGWDGKILNKDGKPVAPPIAEGAKARIRISLLKHFGDPENDGDYESFLSKPISLP